MRRALSRKIYCLRLPIVVVAVLASIAFTSIAALMASNSSAVSPTGKADHFSKSDRPRPKPAAGSTNGPKIVFGSSRFGGNHEVYVMDLDGSNQTRLTNNPAYDDQPKWSPDGTRIVFMSNRDGNFEIYY